MNIIDQLSDKQLLDTILVIICVLFIVGCIIGSIINKHLKK
jgi:hypothetical protein